MPSYKYCKSNIRADERRGIMLVMLILETNVGLANFIHANTCDSWNLGSRRIKIQAGLFSNILMDHRSSPSNWATRSHYTWIFFFRTGASHNECGGVVVNRTSLHFRIRCRRLYLFVYKQILFRHSLTFSSFFTPTLSCLFPSCSNSIEIGCTSLLLWQQIVPASFSVRVTQLKSWKSLLIVNMCSLLWLLLLLLLVRLVFHCQHVLSLPALSFCSSYWSSGWEGNNSMSWSNEASAFYVCGDLAIACHVVPTAAPVTFSFHYHQLLLLCISNSRALLEQKCAKVMPSHSFFIKSFISVPLTFLGLPLQLGSHLCPRP